MELPHAKQLLSKAMDWLICFDYVFGVWVDVGYQAGDG